ncbi:hypothetical protein Sjap_025865 [Stephania japonica]|uniref:Uncharacterized protein n=1 Tax=Stephania japonica TaxID=461633 RepID=A0AAP0HG05_9MAGN
MDFDDKVKLKKVVKDKVEKWKKEKKNKSKEHISASSVEVVEDGSVGKDKVIEGFDNYEREETSSAKIGDESDIMKEKRKKKKKKSYESNIVESVNSKSSEEKDCVGGKSRVEVEHVKEKKKRRKHKKDHSNGEMAEKPVKERSATIIDDKLSRHGSLKSSLKQKIDGKKYSLVDDGMEKSDHIKRKKVKPTKDNEEKTTNKGDPSMIVSDQNVEHVIKSDRKNSEKRVKFSSKIEVFQISDGTKVRKKNQEKKSSFGKRFTQEEDKMIKEAVFNYIAANGLGEEGLNMVLNPRSYVQVRNCWKEISIALPWRSSGSINHRAHLLFERDENHAWTPEQKEFIKKFHEEHGPKWKNMAKELGKFRIHVKDTWRRINLPNLKKGPWSQDEYQALFDLVNMDLRMKAYQERESDNGMLRDNISWEAISRKMGTRTGMQCCLKWYGQLESSLVKEGQWANGDDYLLVNALLTLDACCVEDVNWDALIPDRSGDCCRRRFKQMINHLGSYGVKSFQEQVEVLSNRYCPDLVEVLSTTNGKASAQ